MLHAAAECRGKRGVGRIVFSCCRLSRIRDASGSEVAERLLKEIMGKADFDMEEYDKAMAAAFNEDYYEVLRFRQTQDTTQQLLSFRMTDPCMSGEAPRHQC